VKIGTNLSKKEILDLESVGLQLPQRAVISSRRLFGMEELPVDLSSYPILASPNDYLNTRSGKIIRMNNNAPTTRHANNYASSLTLKGHLCKVTIIPHLGFDLGVLLPLIPELHQKLNSTCSSLVLFLNVLVNTSKTWQQSSWANVASGQITSIFILSLLS
jgi:hypothetical protein